MKNKKYLLLLIPIFITNTFNNFNKWLFGYGTRVIEVLNSWWLMGFGIVMMSNHVVLVNGHPYRTFAFISQFWVWLIVFLVGVFQGIMLYRDCNHSCQYSGITLQLSGLIWFIIAILFGFDYPPVSTALPIYICMSIITGLSGYELLQRSKEHEAKHGV